MRRLAERLKQFRSDERGAFLALFGVLALVLIATTGAVVDFVSVQNARSEAQFALDAAALALQPRIYTDSEATLRGLAQDLVRERVSDPTVTINVETAQKDVEDGSLFLQAQIDVPLAFVSLVGVQDMTTRIAAEATRKQLHLEVAFVLDNSGSMSGSRIAALKVAAQNAINIIFYGTKTPLVGAVQNDNVKAGIVPFTFFVNVGSAYANASWIDRTGNSSIANDNFDDDDDDSTPYTGAVDRIALIQSMSGQSWKGCVESRPYPYSVEDTEPDAGTPDTLFVPSFAPDEPGSAGNPDSGFNNSYLNDTPNACDVLQGSCTCEKQYVDGYYAWGCGYYGGYGWCSGYWETTCEFTDTEGAVSTGPGVCSCGYFYGSGPITCDIYYEPPAYLLSDRELQERLCKYDGASVSYGTWPPHETYTQGPNAGCPNADIEPLTDNVLTLTTNVAAMTADGGTNIHEATAWGFRVLSPTAPFTEGRNYETATSKVIILMTDGENTYWGIDRRYDPYGSPNMNGTYYYMPYGYLWNGRLGTYGVDDQDSMPTLMNARTLETCANAKAEGIKIYTIGLDPPNSTTQTMLENCSSGAGYHYFPTDASELDAVFTEIANQLASLRLAQ